MCSIRSGGESDALATIRAPSVCFPSHHPSPRIRPLLSYAGGACMLCCGVGIDASMVAVWWFLLPRRAPILPAAYESSIANAVLQCDHCVRRAVVMVHRAWLSLARCVSSVFAGFSSLLCRCELRKCACVVRRVRPAIFRDSYTDYTGYFASVRGDVLASLHSHSATPQ